MRATVSKGSSMRAFTGRSVLVTGGASEIGAAIARRAAREGAATTVADADTAGAHTVATRIDARAVHLDVTDPGSWERALDEAGPLDVAWCHAGAGTGEAEITAVDTASYRRTLAVNVDGVVLGTQALVPRLGRGGVVVVSASLAGLTPMPSDPIYAATKHAVVGFVRSYAPTLAARGIRLQALCPGIVDTEQLSIATRSELERVQFPLILPDDVAEGFVRAARSEETGQAWVVQAGRTPEPYRFRGVPGPRVAGAEGMAPPGVPGG